MKIQTRSERVKYLLYVTFFLIHLSQDYAPGTETENRKFSVGAGKSDRLASINNTGN